MRDALPFLIPIGFFFLIGVIARVAALREASRLEHPTDPRK
jgi:hypothetical protein